MSAASYQKQMYHTYITVSTAEAAPDGKKRRHLLEPKPFAPALHLHLSLPGPTATCDVSYQPMPGFRVFQFLRVVLLPQQGVQLGGTPSVGSALRAALRSLSPGKSNVVMMLERMMTDESLQKMMYPYLPVRALSPSRSPLTASWRVVSWCVRI